MKSVKIIKHWKNKYLENIIKNINGILITEEWRDIVGYEGVYQVSSFGRVKRMETAFWSRNKWNDKFLVRRIARIHKFHINKNGRPRVELSMGGVQKIFSLSRLVAVAFVVNENNLPNVCHKDDNPLNNIPENLFWGTQQDNIDDKCQKKRQANGEKNGKSYLKEAQIIQIRRKYSSGRFIMKELAESYGTTTTNISYIVKRKNWKHV